MVSQEKIKENYKRQYAKLYDYKKFFDNESGKRVLYDMMGAHYMMSPAFDKDPIEMARMNGERNVILRILTMLKMKPEDYKKLIEEGDKHVRSGYSPNNT